MNPNVKRALAAGGMAVIAYFVVLPLLWPEPTITAKIPGAARMTETLPIRVALSAWHRNVHAHQVRFYVDYTTTTATGPKGTFYPELILQRDARQFTGQFSRNPITWPHTEYLDMEVALGKYVDQGLIGPGELIGKVDVTFNYHSGRGGKTFRRDRTRTVTKSVPFRITIHE